MTCEATRELIRRRTRGEKLCRSDAKALDAHLHACSECRAEARFEGLLAEAIAEQPAVRPSASFAANVLAALPQQQPVYVPEPSLRWLWGWAAGGIGLAAAAAWGVWHLRETWMGWLFNLEEGAFLNSTVLLYQIQYAVTNANLPLVSIAITALIAFVAWGATALAEPGR